MNATLAPSPAQVRAWARARGLSVGRRGRIPQALLDLYLADLAPQEPADG